MNIKLPNYLWILKYKKLGPRTLFLQISCKERIHQTSFICFLARIYNDVLIYIFKTFYIRFYIDIWSLFWLTLVSYFWSRWINVSNLLKKRTEIIGIDTETNINAIVLWIYQRSGLQESLSTHWKARRQPLPEVYTLRKPVKHFTSTLYTWWRNLHLNIQQRISLYHLKEVTNYSL